MITVMGIILLILLSICVFTNFLTLPGNWLMAFFILLWAFLVAGNTFDLWFFVVFFTLLILGEVLEFYLQVRQTKKAGASNTSNVLGIIGAIVGAILCVPFLFGLGAIFGALIGAWLGTFFGEYFVGDTGKQHAIAAANAALWGKFLGIVIKFGIGCYLVFHTAAYLFPDIPDMHNTQNATETNVEEKKKKQIPNNQTENQPSQENQNRQEESPVIKI